MTGRDSDLRAFLAASGWGKAIQTSLAGDLSPRRYIRLTRAGETAVVMNADPARDASTPAFVTMTGWLQRQGLSAPRILAADPENGLLLLEDLGDAKVSNLASEKSVIYPLAIDLLLHIRACECPALSHPDAAELVDMTRLADQHYPGVDSNGLGTFRAVLETVLADLRKESSAVSLRDFHADNLMWLPERAGLARLGLLDYQDAFITHPAYDLVSLLTDARTAIDPDFRRDMIDLYARRSNDDPNRLGLAFAAFSAQRNLRILGIFSRAGGHLDKLPRVYGYLAEALDHPVFAAVRAETLCAIPAPETTR